MKKVSNNIYQITLGMVNAFVIEDQEGLTIVDTGYKNSTDKIFAAIEKAGKNPKDIKRVILTHSHPDHAGSAAEIKKRLGVPVWAHVEDAKIIEQGIGGRMPMILTPGIINWFVFNLFIKGTDSAIEALTIDQKLNDNDVLPIAGGIQVIHTPGHCAGHIALLIKSEDALIAGDLCANVVGLALSTVHEDKAVAIQSIHKATKLDFSTAVFGHGNPLKGNAGKKMQEKFANAK